MRFTNTLAVFCSATAVTAVALPQLVIPVLNLNGGGGILQVLALPALDNEIVKLQTALTSLNAGSLQSPAGGIIGGVTNLLSPLGLGSTVSGVLNSVVGPVLNGLSGTGGVQTAYANVLKQLNTVNANGLTITPDQAKLVSDFLTVYQAHLQQLLATIQSKQADFTTLSNGSLPSDTQTALNRLLGGGANPGTALTRVGSFLQLTNLNNNNLLAGTTSMVSRAAPSLQGTLQNLTSALQNLISVTVRIYGLNLN